MAGAFQSSAFQNNAFQVDGVVPTPSTGGGGTFDTRGHEARRKKRRAIARMLEEAIKESLEPTVVVAEKAAPVAWTPKKRQAAFPDVWRQQQVLALLDISLDNVAQRIAQIVAAQRVLFEQEQRRTMVLTQDEEAAQALLSLMVRDLI